MTPDVLIALRRIAWQRAKGELNAVLETYFGGTDGGEFEEVSAKIEGFVKSVEDNW